MSKIEKHLDWKEPHIYYKEGCFEIDITEDEIEIECDWDHGYGGRGTEKIYIPTKLMEKLIQEIKKS